MIICRRTRRTTGFISQIIRSLPRLNKSSNTVESLITPVLFEDQRRNGTVWHFRRLNARPSMQLWCCERQASDDASLSAKHSFVAAYGRFCYWLISVGSVCCFCCTLHQSKDTSYMLAKTRVASRALKYRMNIIINLAHTVFLLLVTRGGALFLGTVKLLTDALMSKRTLVFL